MLALLRSRKAVATSSFGGAQATLAHHGNESQGRAATMGWWAEPEMRVAMLAPCIP